MATEIPLLRVEKVSKAFGDVHANSDIDFDLRRGEIHALVGENGAGKTTLMQILFGMHRPDSGTLSIDGAPVVLRRPADAIAHGIGMVHQHFMLVPEFTIAENVTLGAEPARLGFVDAAATAGGLEEPMALLGMHEDAGALTSTLSVARQQRLEILKVIYRGARIMILDEPTAVLTPQETEQLFDTLRALALKGYAVIFISHKLREVMAVADRITVLRGGRTVQTIDVADADIPSLVAAMTGRTTVNLSRVDRPAPTEDVVLEVTGLRGRHRGDAALQDVSFSVHAGEVVGVASVDGNGQNSLVAALVGTGGSGGGSIRIDGHEISHASVAERRDRGVAYVPEDRHAEGLPMSGSVLDGLVGERLARGGAVRAIATAFPASLRTWARGLVERYEIKTAGVDAACRSLSGGNQQKVVIARELDRAPRCIVLAQPTRGVDLGAADFVYSAVSAANAEGTAAVLVSADLDEILRLADRVLVLYRGAIVAERQATMTSREELGIFMMGASEAGA